MTTVYEFQLPDIHFDEYDGNSSELFCVQITQLENLYLSIT